MGIQTDWSRAPDGLLSNSRYDFLQASCLLRFFFSLSFGTTFRRA